MSKTGTRAKGQESGERVIIISTGHQGKEWERG